MSYRTSRSSGYGYECPTELPEVLCRVIPGVNTPGVVGVFPTEHKPWKRWVRVLLRSSARTIHIRQQYMYTQCVLLTAMSSIAPPASSTICSSSHIRFNKASCSLFACFSCKAKNQSTNHQSTSQVSQLRNQPTNQSTNQPIKPNNQTRQQFNQ